MGRRIADAGRQQGFFTTRATRDWRAAEEFLMDQERKVLSRAGVFKIKNVIQSRSLTGSFGRQRQASDVSNQIFNLFIFKDSLPCRHERG
jgi:hypothetical protein